MTVSKGESPYLYLEKWRSDPEWEMRVRISGEQHMDEPKIPWNLVHENREDLNIHQP